jgi:DNA-binding MarR family transcriptional regulator
MDSIMQPTNDIGYLLHHVASVLHRQSDQILQERLGIGLSQYKILMMLQWSPDTSQRQIADSLGQTEASISRQVKLLQDKNMLATQIDPSERRRHITRPTTKGVKITIAAREILDEYHNTMLEALNDKERDQFMSMLARIHETCCAPGRAIACDRPFSIETVYDSHGLK